jgi:hypothetical protein
VWENGVWSWKLGWNCVLSATEEDAAHDLQLLLVQVPPCGVIEDRPRWLASKTGFFSVRSAYLGLLNRTVMDDLVAVKINALKRLWKNNIPSKINIFCWRLLLEKLPTRETLFHKGRSIYIIEEVYFRN